MAGRNWDSNRSVAELGRLLASGVIGFHTHVEVTEIVGFPGTGMPATNVYTLLAAENRRDHDLVTPDFLNTKPIRLRSLRDWTFGLMRYTKPIADLIPAIERIGPTNAWRLSGDPLAVGELQPRPPQFVPANSTDPVPLNGLLKNNFWNGSYVFEWYDESKDAVRPIIDEPRRIQELSEAVQQFVPLRLASLSDRLGNLLVQVPVTVIRTRFGLDRSAHNFMLEVAWHSSATPRPLRAILAVEFDGIVCGSWSSDVHEPKTSIPMTALGQAHRGAIWDDQHRVLLAATAPSAFIESVSLNLRMGDPEPRVFTIRQKDGSDSTYRIRLTGHPNTSIIGTTYRDSAVDWARKRLYSDEMTRLEKTRQFVQYNPKQRNKDAEHERALQDLRFLIDKYGEGGAWLLDPYLNAEDVLNTLFHCKYSGAELKALGSKGLPEYPRSSNSQCRLRSRIFIHKLWNWRPWVRAASTGKPDFIDEQRSELESCCGNCRGLNLEFRVKRGPAGWTFHDRFLIFPNTGEGALAWSLGTSVNSLGMQHHILQRVANGRLVVDAFLDLWNQLVEPEHLVWKKP